MSLYHRRVFLKAKKPDLTNLQKQSTKQQTNQTQSVPSVNDIFPQKSSKIEKNKSSSFNFITQKLYQLSNNQIYSIFMSIITIYTIFAIDIDKAFFNVQASTYFSSIHYFAIALFVFQILILSSTKQGYCLKFYFWIDCFSTLTMFLELIWIQNLMSTSSDVTVALSFAKVTKASRLSKIGARSSKIMKLIRLVKLMKFLDKQDKKDAIIQKLYDEHGKTIIKQQKTIDLQNSTKKQEIAIYDLQNQNKEVQKQRISQNSYQSGTQHKDGQNQNENISENFQHDKIKINKNNHDHRQIQVGQEVSVDERNLQCSVQQLTHTNNSGLENIEIQSPSFHNIPQQSFQNFQNQIHPNNLLNQLNIPEQSFHPYSFSHQSNQMISEDDKNNIQEIMKLFFTKNMNRFVQQGKLISTKSFHTKGENQLFNDNLSKNSNQQEKNQIISSQENKPQLAKRTNRNSSRLSFMKRKQLLDLSKNRQFRQKASRFNPNITAQAPFSNIVQKLERTLNLPPIMRPNVDPQKQQAIQLKYQELVQKLRSQNQPKKVLSSENLKVGEVLKQQIQKNIVIMVMGLIMILPIITADTWFDSDVLLNTTANLFIEDINLIPTQQGRSQLLQSFIETGQQMNNPLQYFFIPVNSTCCEFPRQFASYINSSYLGTSNLRLSQQTIVIDADINIVFSKKISSQITAYLNLGRSLFITILLIFCSILFMKDIQNYALNPLQKMFTLINKISNNPFEALKQINEQKNSKFCHSGSLDDDQNNKMITQKVVDEQDQKLQTNILSNVIIKITSLLTIGAGQIGSEIISRNIEDVNEQKNVGFSSHNDTVNNTKNQQKSIGQSQIAVYVYLQFRQFDIICDIFGDQIFKYINKVTQIIHQSTIEFGGIPIEYDSNGFLLLWKLNSQDVNPLEQTMSPNQNQSLAKLSILALHAVTKIYIDISTLQQSRKFYQFISQKYSTESQNNGQKLLFNENYEPHLLNASIHVGESFYGSMGSQYKLQCKCIGYDIAYTRYLANMIEQQNYNVGTIISQDIYLLLQEHQNVIQRLKIRKIDQIKLKQIRFKDKSQNPNITYMNKKQLQSIKSAKTTKSSIYTFDFSGKLQMFNSNQSQLMNLYTPNMPFSLNKTHQISQHSYYVENKSVQHEKVSKTTLPNINSLGDMEDQKNQKIVTTYQQRDKWLSVIEIDSPSQLITKLQSQYPQIKESRASFEVQFYQNWSDALQCYYARQFTEAINQFKFLHTYNQPYYDWPSKIFITRIQNMSLQDIQSENIKNQDNNSDYSESNSDQSYHHKKTKRKWNGTHQILWKL